MDTKACGVHKLVASIVVLSGGKVLLVKYKDPTNYDGQRGWFIPNDYLAFEEHPNDAARRILLEQVGIGANFDAVSYIESFAGGPEEAWHLIFHHKLELARAAAIRLRGNVGEAQWFPIDKMPPKREIAHGGWANEVLREVLRR